MFHKKKHAITVLFGRVVVSGHDGGAFDKPLFAAWNASPLGRIFWTESISFPLRRRHGQES